MKEPAKPKAEEKKEEPEVEKEEVPAENGDAKAEEVLKVFIYSFQPGTFLLHSKNNLKTNVCFVCTATMFKENRMIEHTFFFQETAAADEAVEKEEEEEEDKPEEEEKAAE